MAQYLYRCNDCERIFDVEQGRDEDHVSAFCPTCGQPCDRVWTAPVLVFRGPDFSLALQAEETERAESGDPLCEGIDGLERVA